MADVCSEADENDGNGDKGGTGNYKGAAAAVARGAPVAIVTDCGLDEEAGNRPAEPYEGGPFVGDAEELYIGC